MNLLLIDRENRQKKSTLEARLLLPSPLACVPALS